MSILNENWHIWFFGGVDSMSRLRFLKFQPPKIYFWANLGPKIQSCPFCLNIGAQSISRMPIPNPDLDFWNLDPKIHFWGNVGPKTQSCPFCLKMGAHKYLKDADLESRLRFLKFGPQNSFLGKFVWKVVYIVSQGCWFLLQH